MKDHRKCMVHFEDKGMFPSALEDSGRFLARIPRGLGVKLMLYHLACYLTSTWDSWHNEWAELGSQKGGVTSQKGVLLPKTGVGGVRRGTK